MSSVLADGRPMPEWKVIEGSSNVRAVCFDAYTEVEILSADPLPVGAVYVAFRNGGVYKYEPVAECVYQAILDAESKGRAVSRLLGRHGEMVAKRSEL